jgi:hypothetical protein
MSDGRLALIFFEVGMVLTLVSMVLGPYDITEWAISAAVVACFVALGGMYLAFSSWDEPDEPHEQADEPQDPQEHTL